MKIAAMSKPTFATATAARTARRAVGGTAARSMSAPAPATTLARSAVLCRRLRSAQAENPGAIKAEASMAAASVHGQTTPGARPQGRSANATFST